MNVPFLAWLSILTAATYTKGSPIFSYRELSSPCGDWAFYKDEKCFKIVSTAGEHTLEEAEKVCKSFGEELKLESHPRVITIATKEEQDFLHQWLFVKNQLVENVWLGMKGSGNPPVFKWSDGSNVVFSNWGQQNVTDSDHKCVELSSGAGGFASGLWVKVNCKKLNVIVCERPQVWSLETLKNWFLDFKSQQEKLKGESDQKLNTLKSNSENEISSLKKRNADAEKNINDLKQKNAAIEKNIGALEHRNEAEEKNITALEQKNSASVKDIATLKQRNDAADKVVATMKQRIDVADKNTVDLKAKQEAAEKNVAALKLKSDASDKNLATLKQRSDASDNNIASIKQTVEAANKNVAALKQTSDAANQIINTLKQKSEAADKIINDLKQKNVASDKNIAAIKQKSDAAENTSVTLSQKQAVIEKDFAATKEKVGASDKVVASLKQKSDAAEKTINDIKQKHDAAEKNVLAIKQKNDALEKTVTSLTQKIAAAEKNIAALTQKAQSALNEVNTFKQNPVPVGFIYVELPGQQPPATLWPQTKWTDISAKYAGQFFRVVGGGSAPFGKVQEGAAPRLEQVNYAGKEVQPQAANPITIPADGSWSKFIWDGTTNGDNLYLRFHLLKTEVRPKNQAVKIWQRIK